MVEHNLYELTHDTLSWRRYIAAQLARDMDYKFFGVKNIYLFGSVENGSTGIGSDIDLIIYTDNTKEQNQLLLTWLDGWNKSLCHFNYLITGLKSEFMLDIHLVDDNDIKQNTTFASKLSSVYEPVELLRA